MSLSKLFVLASSMALMSSAATAATTIQSVAADFSNPVGATQYVTYTNADGLPGNERIFWGQGVTSSSQSGLTFSSTPANAITQGTQFTLGMLIFDNVVIGANSSITSVDLSLSALLNVDGATVNTGPFTFSIAIDDTPNQGTVDQCPYTSNLPCSDKISITTGSAAQTFQLGDQTLTLYIDGFLDRTLTPQSSFIAQELESTSATLIGHFDVASDVPEPASWAMLVAGFGLTGAAIRRSRRVAFGAIA